jgi:transposase
MASELDPLVERLQRENAELLAENGRLRQQVTELLGRIAELERAAARQAGPFRREEQKKIPPDQQKKPGRKPGHLGCYRRPPSRVDQQMEVLLPACPQCGGAITDRQSLTQYIEEIPPVRPLVVRLTTWSGVCPQCGVVHSSHPLQTSRAQGAARTQLGPRALSLAALLNKHMGLPMGRTCQVLRKICGLSITRGGLSQALVRVAAKLAPQYDALVHELRGSAAVFADETSWWVGGPGWWLWTFTNPQTTLYRVEKARGGQVVRDTLSDYQGMLVSDCLASYDSLPYRKHKCIAHHLRAITQARDRSDTPDKSYLDQWKLLFDAVFALYKAREGMPPERFVEERGRIEAWCDRLVRQSVTQPGDVAVQKRLAKQWAHLLGCLHEPAAEPTNNRAERALRPAVVARKLSCGNKTERGKRCWEILASLAATAHQKSEDFVDKLTCALPLAPQAG